MKTSKRPILFSLSGRWRRPFLLRANTLKGKDKNGFISDTTFGGMMAFLRQAHTRIDPCEVLP
ncbi:MAG: hypothetical protein KC592_11560 [Nitrospira sp.]|nr:hypothetical protein [Nitrospira sp.]